MLRFVALAVLLLQPAPPSIILLDEPELGLHPFALGLLAALMREAAVQSQLVVATQSPVLIDEFEPAEVLVVDLSPVLRPPPPPGLLFSIDRGAPGRFDVGR
jgi:predicted ATPase